MKRRGSQVSKSPKSAEQGRGIAKASRGLRSEARMPLLLLAAEECDPNKASLVLCAAVLL